MWTDSRFHPHFRDQNRRDMGKSQSTWTDAKMETARSHGCGAVRAGQCQHGRGDGMLSCREVDQHAVTSFRLLSGREPKGQHHVAGALGGRHCGRSLI
eukprot:COSAG01_NODE_340_length_18638_cov_56.516505_18_plen_98_part_00